MPLAISQTNRLIINGNISNINNGKIYIVKAIPDNFYDSRNSKFDSGRILNGEFTISIKQYDTIPTPYRFIIKSKEKNGITGMVIFKSKRSLVKIDSIDEYISPFVFNNLINDELINTYTKENMQIISMGKSLDFFVDSISQLYKNEIPDRLTNLIANNSQNLISKSDSLLYNYIRVHSDSYVSVFKLIERFHNSGYKEIYKKAYNLLSMRLQLKKPVVELGKKLKKTEILAFNNVFPKLTLKNSKLENFELDVFKIKSRFILIDFWFSECQPCILQMNGYKKLYKYFSNKDFAIVGISIDRANKIDNWRNVIKRNEYTWMNYLDWNRSECNRLGINYFPTTILINERREIVGKNLTYDEIEKKLSDIIKSMIFNDQSIEPK